MATRARRLSSGGGRGTRITWPSLQHAFFPPPAAPPSPGLRRCGGRREESMALIVTVVPYKPAPGGLIFGAHYTGLLWTRKILGLETRFGIERQKVFDPTVCPYASKKRK